MGSHRRWLFVPMIIGLATPCLGDEVAEIVDLSGELEVTHLVDDSSDRKPLQTQVPQYPYPEKARRQRLEGEVEVCFHVDREGRTSRVGVRRSTNRIFEKPSMLAVRASTYRPLPEGSRLSGIKTCRTFRFRLTPVAIEQPR